MVLPGFNDAHVDLIAGGLDWRWPTCSDAATAEEVLDRVRTWSEANPRAAWVIGRVGRRTCSAAACRRADARRGRQGPAGAVLWRRTNVTVGVGELAGTAACRHHPDDSAIRPRRHRARGAERRTVRCPAWTRRRGARGTGPNALGRRTAAGPAARPSPKPTTRGITSAQNTAADCEQDLDLFDSIRREREMTLRIYCVGSRRPFSHQGRSRSRALRRAA